jgi:putative chitinase
MNYLVQYQQLHGLTPDGIVGKQTAAVIIKDLKIPNMIAFCHFMGQVYVESAEFTAGRENLNYSARGLKENFKKYFLPAELIKYERKPEQIANRVYGNRMGNGPESSGDGWKHRGAGALQLTGKSNFEAFFKYIGMPLDTDPAEVIKPENYFKAADFFFDSNGVWKYCIERSDSCIIKVSKAINLGNANSPHTPNGLDERLEATHSYFKKLC